MTRPAYRGRWKQVRLAILERDGYLCMIRLPCCTQIATEVDHIIQPSAGGRRLDPDNLRAACQPCNSARGGHQGQLTRRHQATTPSRNW